jgi:hypothetical protein
LNKIDFGNPTSHELKLAHESLSLWHHPSAFAEYVDKWPSNIVVRTRFLQEAWVLAEFAKRVEVQRLRLSCPSEQWPDAYVKIGGISRYVEITEVLEPDRRRDDELRDEDVPDVWLDPVENWVARANAIPGALRTRLQRKAQKRYGSPVVLLVYLNISEWGIRQTETEQTIADLKAEHGSAFEQIVVLWKDKLY